MNAPKPMLNTLQIASMLLGKFAIWLGSVVAPIYIVGYGLLTSHHGFDRPEATGLALPLVLPEAGLLICVLGVLLAWIARRPVPWVCVAGFLLNAVPMVLALLLQVMRSGS